MSLNTPFSPLYLQAYANILKLDQENICTYIPAFKPRMEKQSIVFGYNCTSKYNTAVEI